MQTLPSVRDSARTLWELAGLDPAALDRLEFDGDEPGLPSSFRVGAFAQCVTGLTGLAAAQCWARRGNPEQDVRVAMRAACAEFRSERLVQVDGQAMPELWDKIAGIYPCGEGGYVRLHTNFAHHRDGVLALLDCAYERDAVTRRLAHWNAFEFEAQASARGLCVAAARSAEEWRAGPQALALSDLPVFSIEPLGEAPPRVWRAARRPLEGIRVLDLTRIIAGPVCARTLAAHGADVLGVAAPHLPSIRQAVIDTGRGKRQCFVDLREAEGRARLRELIRNADVFLQAYRPGALDALGFGPDAVAELRPGIVYVSLSAYGHLGPWRDRRGFDSLVQMTTGINTDEAKAAGQVEPKPLPAQALDHGAGQLLALACMAALLRQSDVGQGALVRTSLAQVARWLRGLGRLEHGLEASLPDRASLLELLESGPSGFGRLEAVAPAAQLARTPAYYARPALPLGSGAATWDA